MTHLHTPCPSTLLFPHPIVSSSLPHRTDHSSSSPTSVPSPSPLTPPPGGATYCPGRRFARNEVKTIVAVLLTQFDLSIVDPPRTGSTGSGAPVSATQGGDVFDTREVGGPGINGARAGLGIFSPKNEVRLKISRRK